MAVENSTYQGDLRCEFTAGSGTYTTIGDVYDITPPMLKVDAKEKTKLASTARWKEFGPAAFTDPDGVSAMLRFDAVQTETLINLRNATRKLRLVINDHDTDANRSRFDFDGFWTEFGLQDLQIDGDFVTTKITFKASGAVTFTKRVP